MIIIKAWKNATKKARQTMVEIVQSLDPLQFAIMGIVYLFTLGYSIYMAVLNRRQANVQKLMKINNEQNAEIIKVLRNLK